MKATDTADEITINVSSNNLLEEDDNDNKLILLNEETTEAVMLLPSILPATASGDIITNNDNDSNDIVSEITQDNEMNKTISLSSFSSLLDDNDILPSQEEEEEDISSPPPPKEEEEEENKQDIPSPPPPKEKEEEEDIPSPPPPKEEEENKQDIPSPPPPKEKEENKQDIPSPPAPIEEENKQDIPAPPPPIEATDNENNENISESKEEMKKLISFAKKATHILTSNVWSTVLFKDLIHSVTFSKRKLFELRSRRRLENNEEYSEIWRGTFNVDPFYNKDMDPKHINVNLYNKSFTSSTLNANMPNLVRKREYSYLFVLNIESMYIGGYVDHISFSIPIVSDIEREVLRKLDQLGKLIF